MVDFLFPTRFLFSAESFLFWKYLEITLTSLFDLTGRGGGGGTLSIVTGTVLVVFLLLLLLLRAILGVNLDAIFALRVVDLLSV